MFKLLLLVALCSQVEDLKNVFSNSTAPAQETKTEHKMTYRDILKFISELPKDKLDDPAVFPSLQDKNTEIIDKAPPEEEVEVIEEKEEEDVQPGFVVFKSVRQKDQSLGKVLADIDSHLPAGHQYRDSDRVTWGHETTHGINSEIRNKYSGRNRVNGFYCLEDRGVVIREPQTTIRTVAAKVPSSLRGDVYALYMVDQASGWNDTPLYIFDEWVAYTNGSEVRKDLKIQSRDETVKYMMEFNVYALTLAKVVNEKGGYDDKQFKAFLKWNIKRSMNIYNGETKATNYLNLLRKNKDADGLRVFAREYLGEKWCKEVLKF